MLKITQLPLYLCLIKEIALPLCPQNNANWINIARVSNCVLHIQRMNFRWHYCVHQRPTCHKSVFSRFQQLKKELKRSISITVWQSGNIRKVTQPDCCIVHYVNVRVDLSRPYFTLHRLFFAYHMSFQQAPNLYADFENNISDRFENIGSVRVSI